jgi:patatin-like phospholipase/acyl hydrolase
MTTQERLETSGSKKLLTLDGGGIRGALTIEVLAEIESMLRRELDQPKLLLADYFDYISGTSTGAILAASLAIGMTTDELRTFYEESGSAMFDKASLLRRHRYKYEDEALADKLKSIFGADTQLGSDKLRTLLMMVMRNATTDSPWPVSNNPRAMFNNTGDDQDNLKIPLWQLIRASTAAPVYFPPEQIQIGKNSFLFVDGGITMFNNPSFQTFIMATIPEFHIEWPAGEDRMLLVSVGTGHAPDANKDLGASEMNILYNAGSIPGALMTAALHEQDALCRIFGRCLVGDPIDLEVGDLKGKSAPGGKNLFTYVRYNAELTARGLTALGVGDIEPKKVQKLDSIAGIADLQRVGRALAKSVNPVHYEGFLEATGTRSSPVASVPVK